MADVPTIKPCFAPLPMRATSDNRLSLRHFRILAVVAAHDRLNKNKAGCWASHRRLAALAGCGLSRLSDTLGDLVDFGYLSSDPHPMNRKLRVYRVIYSIHDHEVMCGVSNDTFPKGKRSPSVVPTDTFPKGKQSLGQERPDFPESDEIVSHEKQQAADPAQKSQLNIFRESKINSSEEASSTHEAILSNGRDPDKDFW